MQELLKMQDAKPIVLCHNAMVIARENMLFCLCRVCANEINWRHCDASFLLHATCCCFVYYALPTNQKMNFYGVSVTQANMQNVYWLYRKSPLEPEPRHA